MSADRSEYLKRWKAREEQRCLEAGTTLEELLARPCLACGTGRVRLTSCLNVSEWARLIGVVTKTVRMWMANGKLKEWAEANPPGES